MDEPRNMESAVYDVERKKWNALAMKELRKIRPMVPGDNFYLFARRSSTMLGMAEFLGDLRGKQVLEYGCGLGQISVLLAKCGANVTTFDLSRVSVEVTSRRAELNGVADLITAVVGAGENPPFANNSFDIVVGKAILHHLNVELAAPHLHRVLKRNGKAAFAEPMGMNPFLRFGREHLPYAHKNPRGADLPLDYDTIDRWGKEFRDFSYRELQLVSMLERVFGFNRQLDALRRLDEVLLNELPFLRRYCRYVVLYMTK